jgi:hypothetical protein
MRITLLANRDLPSNLALNYLVKAHLTLPQANSKAKSPATAT